MSFYAPTPKPAFVGNLFAPLGEIVEKKGKNKRSVVSFLGTLQWFEYGVGLRIVAKGK